MVYTYDEKNKKLKSVKVPKITGNDAIKIKNAKVPKSFLESVMKIKLNIISA